MKADTLRKSILQYAIQGKLVQQKETEEPANLLLDKIREEKELLVKKGEIKKSKPLPPITDEEKKFDIPDSWIWVRLGECINLTSGQDMLPNMYNESKVGVPYITGASNFDGASILINRWTTNPKSVAYKGDLLLTCKGTVGAMAILKEEMAHIARQVMSLHAYMIDILFLKYFIECCVYELKAKATSMIPGISREDVLFMVLSLPPLEEQRRIVTRIEELMILVDQYERKQIELDKLEIEFPEKLKRSVLKYAMQGKLVSQIETEEPVSVLLEKIKAEKELRIKEGKIKSTKPLPPIIDDDKPFEIPENWEWVRLGDLAEYKKGPFGSSLTKAMFVAPSETTVKVYEQKNAINKSYELGDYYISREKFETMQGFIVCPKDIIVSCAGTIGEAYLLPSDAPIGIINQALMRVRLHSADIIEYFLLYFEYIVTVASKLDGNGSAIKNIPPLDELKKILLPLPPVQEQTRILQQIKYMYTLIEQISSGNKLKKGNSETVTFIDNVVDMPARSDKTKFDISTLGMVARKEGGVSEEDVSSALRQVQEFYDKKN